MCHRDEVVTGGLENIAYSQTGIAGSWTVVDLGRPILPACSLGPTCNDVDDIVLAGRNFIAVTHPNAEVFTSQDLRIWTQRETGLAHDGTGLWVTSFAEGVSLVGGGRGKLAASYDNGIHWFVMDSGFADDGIITLGYGAGVFLVAE